MPQPGHNGKQNYCVTASFPPTCSIIWWTVSVIASCPINVLSRPRPANVTSSSPSRAAVPCGSQECRGDRTLVDVERLVLQEFIGTAPWDHRPLVSVLVGQVVDQLGSPMASSPLIPAASPSGGRIRSG